MTLLPAESEPDLARFYGNVTDNLRELADCLKSEVKRGDLVQLEISGQNKRDHIVMAGDDGDVILPAFKGLLERVMQSNIDLETTLECELNQKKRRHLYYVLNKNQLCFAVNLAHLTRPGLTHVEALERGRELQCLASLDAETLMTLSDMFTFKEVVKHKIVVLDREFEGRALRLFDTVVSGPVYALCSKDIIPVLDAIITASSTCQRARKCPKCHLLYQVGEKHACPKESCKICGVKLESEGGEGEDFEGESLFHVAFGS